VVAILDQGVNLTGQQIDARQQANRAVLFVFMIAARSRARPAPAARSGAVVAIAWIPRLSSYAMIATASFRFFCRGKDGRSAVRLSQGVLIRYSNSDVPVI